MPLQVANTAGPAAKYLEKEVVPHVSGPVIATGSAVDSVAQEDAHDCNPVAAITGWAAKR